jgi:hypothetical protein
MALDVNEPGRGVLPPGRRLSRGAIRWNCSRDTLVGEGWVSVTSRGPRFAATSPVLWKRAAYDRGGRGRVGRRASGASARVVREIDIQRRPLARDGCEDLPYADAQCLLAYDDHEHRGGARDGVVRRCRAGPDCSNRWACTASIAVTATARPSPSPRHRRTCGDWARRAPPSAPRVPTSARSLPTGRPASNNSPT